MKGHKLKKADGGEAMKGRREWEEDNKSKPARYDEGKPEDEAEEESGDKYESEAKKRGGRAKRKEGGKVHGELAVKNAGRKPRKAGGRSGADKSPLSSAHHGTDPKKHSDMEIG